MATVDSSHKLGNPVYPIMFAIGVCHLFNDSLQAVIPAMFPVLAKEIGLTFTQLGLISFVLNIVASLLQPVVGFISDKKANALCTSNRNDELIYRYVRISICTGILDYSCICYIFRSWICCFSSRRFSCFIHGSRI